LAAGRAIGGGGGVAWGLRVGAYWPAGLGGSFVTQLTLFSFALWG
jgi:hypothetical protein